MDINKFQIHKYLLLTIFNIQLLCNKIKYKNKATLTVNYLTHLTDDRNFENKRNQ